MPTRFRGYGEAWAVLNPDCTVRDWSWADLPDDLANQAIMDDLRRRCTKGDSIELPTQLADIISYDLVHRHGGVYVNCDVQPLKPLLPEMKNGGAWASWEEPWAESVVNCVMGGADSFWELVVAELADWYFARRVQGFEEMNQLTGPAYLTSRHKLNPGSLRVYPSSVFNPVYWGDIPPGQTAESRVHEFPDAIAVHHWDHRNTGRSNIVS
jgi:mannosyltransferase OCH1-like enzyme